MGQRSILHIIGASAFGGIAAVVAEATRAAVDAGWRVEVITTNPRFQTLAADAGATVIDLDVAARPIRPLRDLRDLRRLTRFLREHRYDVIQTHTWKGSMLGRLAARLARSRNVVVTAHGTPWKESSSSMLVRTGALIERWAARFCVRIVTVSRFHRDWFVRLRIAPPEKFVVIQNAIGDEDLRPSRSREEVRDELGVAHDEFVVLFAGRLIREKGIFDLVEAAERVFGRGGAPGRVLIAGEGPDGDRLRRRVAASPAAGSITVLGFRTDIPDLLEAADIMVFPSHRAREGFPIALLEALAVGTPVAASSLGCNVELLEEGRGSILFEPEDPDGLVAAIRELAESPDLRRALGDDGRRLYLERYQPERMHRAYRQLYEDLVPAPSE